MTGPWKLTEDPTTKDVPVSRLRSSIVSLYKLIPLRLVRLKSHEIAPRLSTPSTLDPTARMCRVTVRSSFENLPW